MRTTLLETSEDQYLLLLLISSVITSFKNVNLFCFSCISPFRTVHDGKFPSNSTYRDCQYFSYKYYDYERTREEKYSVHKDYCHTNICLFRSLNLVITAAAP